MRVLTHCFVDILLRLIHGEALLDNYFTPQTFRFTNTDMNLVRILTGI